MIELPIESQFQLCQVRSDLEKASVEQQQELALFYAEQLLRQRDAFKAHLTQAWGLKAYQPNSPEHTALLQAHYDAATKVLDCLTDEKMLTRLAVTAQGAHVALGLQSPTHEQLKLVVGAVIRVLLSDWSAVHCRNLQAHIEGNHEKQA